MHMHMSMIWCVLGHEWPTDGVSLDMRGPQIVESAMGHWGQYGKLTDIGPNGLQYDLLDLGQLLRPLQDEGVRVCTHGACVWQGRGKGKGRGT